MLVTIIYNVDFRDEANSLKAEVVSEWSDVSINMMGINDTINDAKYQIQLNGGIVYTGVEATDNTTIINLIEERL